MRLLIHIANVLFLLSYLVRDILWLRCLTLIAGVLLVIYFGAQQPAQIEPVAWNVLFLVLNVFQLVRLLKERRPVHLQGDEATLHRLAFQALSPRDFLRLVRLGTWKNAAAGDELVEEGKTLHRLLALQQGRVVIEAQGKPVTELGAGRFIGEMSFLTSSLTSACVRAVEPCRYLELPSDALRTLLQGEPELRAAFQLVLGTDLVSKLRRS